MGNKIETEADIFGNFLKSKGLSSTKQRNYILREVFRNHDHFEAEDIVDALKKRKSRVGRATVYRTLSHLEECGLIRRVDLGHGHSHYEHTLGHTHHEHLYCERCGKIVEFTDTILEKRILRIAEKNLFALTNHTVQMFGVCEDCRAGKSGKSR